MTVVTFRNANMADRKGRSVTFRTAHHLSLRALKRAIDGEITSSIVVFQDLGNEEYFRITR